MRYRPTRVTLGWGIVVVVGLGINGRLQGDLTGNTWRLLEAGMLLALLLGLGVCPPVRTAFQGLGAFRRRALLGVLCLVGVAHIADRPRVTYPFVPWSMYSGADVTPEYIEYSATLESGEAIDFPFHSVIPTHEPRGLSYNFNRRLQKAKGPRADSIAKYEVARLIRSLAEIYNERHPQNAIRHIDIRSRSIPLHDFEGRKSLVSQPLIRSAVPEPLR